MKDENGYDRFPFTGFRVCEAQVAAVLVGSLAVCDQEEPSQGGLGGWARRCHRLRYSQWCSGSLPIRRRRRDLISGPPFPGSSFPPTGITWRWQNPVRPEQRREHNSALGSVWEKADQLFETIQARHSQKSSSNCKGADSAAAIGQRRLDIERGKMTRRHWLRCG